MATSVLAWRIPGMGEPGGLLSMGWHRVGHDWSDLAAAAARALKIVENVPCSCGFSEHLSKHTQNIRQIVPTNVDHCLNSKSSFCIILFWYRRGNSAIKKYQKVVFFFLWPSVSRSLRSLASQLVLISAGRAQGYEVGCFRPLPSSLVTLPPLPPPTSRSPSAAPQMSHSFLLSSMVSVKLGSLFMMAASALSADSAPFASLVW